MVDLMKFPLDCKFGMKKEDTKWFGQTNKTHPVKAILDNINIGNIVSIEPEQYHPVAILEPVIDIPFHIRLDSNIYGLLGGIDCINGEHHLAVEYMRWSDRTIAWKIWADGNDPKAGWSVQWCSVKLNDIFRLNEQKVSMTLWEYCHKGI